MKTMSVLDHKTLILKTGFLLSVLFMFIFKPGLQAQQNSIPKLKATEVDTLWGHDNSTPDSVIYNIFSRPYIVKTYGKEGNDPNLDWTNMTSSEKASYFKKAMQKFIELYPKYDIVNNKGDTVLMVNNELCYFYTIIADYVIGGENNIENDPDPANVLNKYPDIKQITIDNNGSGNLPILYITDINGDSINGYGSHSISGIDIKNKITQNTTLKDDFQNEDSRTNIQAVPGNVYMATKGTVTVNREGYFDGQFDKSTNLSLMTFQFDSTGTSYLTYINPRLYTINPKIIQIQNKAPADTVIDYSSDWANKLKPFITLVNQDTTAKIHTEDNNSNITNITYVLKENQSISDTIPLMTGEAARYNYKVTRENIAQFVQDGEQINDILPSGRHYYTILKEDTAMQTVIVKDMEPPTGVLSKRDTTISDANEAEKAALALITDVKDNSGSTVYKRDTLVSSSDSLMTYKVGLEDVTGNKTSLGEVDVRISTTGIQEHISNNGYGILKVWPNPVKGSVLQIEYNAKTAGYVSFELFNILGNRIRIFTRNLSQGMNQVEISLQGVPGGDYVIGCGKQMVKAVVER